MNLNRRVLTPTLLLAAIVAGVLAYFAHDSVQRATALHADALQVQRATALAFALDDAVQEEDRWIASIGAGSVRVQRERIDAANQRVATLVAEIQSIHLPERAAHTLSQFIEARESVSGIRADVIEAAERGEAGALGLSLEKWRLMSLRADALLKNFGAYYLRFLDRTVRDAEQRSARALAVAGIGLVMGVLVAVAFAMAIARTVVRPIVSIATTAERIAATGLQSRVSGSDRDDEIGTLARAFNEMTERFVTANDRLEQADRRKDEFLGMLSHELRNPLASIRNSTYVLRRAGAGSDRADRAQAVIERQTEHLTRLVDDLLDVTRIVRGKIDLRRGPADLRDIVARAADDFRPGLGDGGIEFDVSMPEAPLPVEADETRITQVVGNLLDNAAKFTPRGGRVVLSLGQTTDGHAEIRVADTGVGVAPALLPTIFEPFVQGDRTLARSEGGLGLGLALVKGIAELHGGSVRVESDGHGTGATFLVRLPLATASMRVP